MQTVTRARRLRREMTLPEVLLWQALRERPDGLKFRHQHPAGQYVLDFYCVSARLAIEVDGEAHGRGDRPERDARRDAWLAREEVRVLRIPAKVILDDVAAAIEHIVARASPDQPLHHASPAFARDCASQTQSCLAGGEAKRKRPPRSGEELKGQ